MKEKPILFSAPMVQAILAGRKTQTRRVIKPQPTQVIGSRADYVDWKGECFWNDELLPELAEASPWYFCDQLWVRETFRETGSGQSADGKLRGPLNYEQIVYRADVSGFDDGPWRPSIFMPRWASRIYLNVIAVSVQKLQAITNDEALAEGVAAISKDGKLTKYGIPDRDGLPGTDNQGWPWDEWCLTPIEAFKKLWININGQEAWDSNPFVWVIRFDRAEA